MSRPNPHVWNKSQRKILDEARNDQPEAFERIMAQFEAGEITRADALWLLGYDNAPVVTVELFDLRNPYVGRPSRLRGKRGHDVLLALAHRACEVKARKVGAT